jgi:hypothetical protein
MFWLCPLPSLSDLGRWAAMIGRSLEDQLFHHPWCRGQKGDEPEPIDIDGHATVRAASFKLETCIIRGGPCDHSIAVLDAASHLLPDHLAHLSRIRSDIDSRPNFEEPYGETA